MLSALLASATRVLLGAQPRWIGCRPAPTQRIYYANHSSHFDTLALWSALPPRLRATTRVVAARDYWGSGARAWLAKSGFNALFIDRQPRSRSVDPLAPLDAALHDHQSLIVFPEGTRRVQALPGAFKSGLYHLAQRHPHVELLPVYLDNLWRSLPKGTWLPVPLTCAVRFGTPLARLHGEDKTAFLERARAAIVALA